MAVPQNQEEEENFAGRIASALRVRETRGRLQRKMKKTKIM